MGRPPRRKDSAPPSPPVVGIGPLSALNYLWHYTNWEAFESIVRTGVMWASNLQFLNDEQEYIHAVTVFIERLSAQYQDSAKQPIDQTDAEFVRNYLMHAASWPRFVVCFSEAPDQLSQWRAYSGAGPGVSIGFGRSALEALAENAGATFGQCIYEPRRQHQLLQPIIQKLFDYWPDKEVTGMDRTNWLIDALADIFIDFSNLAVLLKNHSFSEEKEWRIVAPPPKPYAEAYRVHRAGSLIVPHVELNLADPARKPIERIVVGPSPHTAKIARMAFDLVYLLGYRILAEPSEIPYRNW